jgi:putative NADH-flavin reductase
MRVAVIGASGRIGGRIVAEALDRQHAVIAAVRHESSPGDAYERADVFDPASVAAVAAGCDVVVSAVGHAARLDDRGYYVRAARSLVEALRGFADDRPRMLVVGGFGSLEAAPGTQFADAGGFPDDAAPEIVGQRDALTYYRSITDVVWTYLSPPPGGIAPGERTGVYRISRDRVEGEPGASLISMEDFAVAVVDESERSEYPFACVAVSGISPTTVG